MLSHFHFVERFCVNTVYREQFHESMWRKQENHLSSQNNNFKEEIWRRSKIDVVKITDSLCLNDFREAAMRGKDSNSRDRERHRHDDTRRDRDERRRRERSPDRSTRHVRESSERHGENSHRSSRDREDDKWRRRPERDDDNRGRMRNDSRTFLRPSDIDSR